MFFERKYGVPDAVSGIPLIEAGAVDYKINPTLTAGDVKISKDDGAFVNLATLPTVTPSGATSVKISLSAAEHTCKRAVIKFVDQTVPKEWEDQEIIIETYGHASSQHPFKHEGVWVVGTRTLTDKTGFFISGAKTTLDDLNDLSAADIAALFAGLLDSGVLVSGITITDGDPIEVTRGDTKLVTINLGSQWPLTGKLVYFIVKKDQTADNGTAIVNREVDTIVDEANGIAQILLTSEEMAVVDCYHYEVELRRDPEDDQPETPKQGKWKINQDTRQ